MAKPEALTRQLVSTIKLVINAGAAKPSPPVGPALGQAGLNIMSFCKVHIQTGYVFGCTSLDIKNAEAKVACMQHF